MESEKITKAMSGYSILMLFFALLAVAVFSGVSQMPIPAVLLGVVAFFILPGFSVINPNEGLVITLFGVYKGTVKQNGFLWMNPFFTKKKVSLRAMNLNGSPIKVNDKVGNPIEIAAVIVWQVQDTAKAVFEVDNYFQFIAVQSEAAVRSLAGAYPYDHFEDEESSITLRAGTQIVNEKLEEELNERLSRAGILILEARISHLAYSAEIAGAMLQRQQAQAVVAARKTIVEGAVGMVEMALAKLSERNIVDLDDERKAAMVSNLLVVLCAEKSVSPVVNAGSIY
ncbi:MAG: SPFH domain-containing protein [Sphingobacteriales bacterium]|jgi:regulator of protease activity HflC (stomatin/prohibitin superfamily)|nr:SPFH domain-containing protein [Sphingobacteriales bacterium]